MTQTVCHQMTVSSDCESGQDPAVTHGIQSWGPTDSAVPTALEVISLRDSPYKHGGPPRRYATEPTYR